MHYNVSEQDIYLFHQGTNYNSYKLLGSHFLQWKGQEGFRFAVWAPNAKEVSVVGDFNNWRGNSHPLEKITNEGLWVGFFSDIEAFVPYKYEIKTYRDETLLKADPYAFQAELRPRTASITIKDSTYQWRDEEWQVKKKKFQPYSSPISIYEVHLGSWRKTEDGDFYSYKELAEQLIPYVERLGYTHIEILPITEHPFDLSWGYQTTGYYAPTSRYGSVNELKYFIDECHRHNIGVIMDWVPGHFCKDDFGLREFDGLPVYEYADPKKAEKKLWGTLTFDFGRPEVQSFLISNAVFWIQEFHLDGIRVDAVASMIYLNFDRGNEEEKIYNAFGTEENLEAVALIKKLNEVVFSYEPNVLMMAEDSSDYPLVTAPTHSGGLGFNFKWNMGWMNDTLEYMKKDPVYRKWHHNLLTFSFMYTFSENYVLPLSHDEVVHGKKSLLDKMPGDQWQQFASLRLLYGYLICHPGKKLLFMGGELGHYAEWKYKEQLDWHLLDYPLHASLHEYVKELNHFYLENPALYQLDHDTRGFEWIDPHNIDQSIIAFLRNSENPQEQLIIVCNFTPSVYYDYKIGVPIPGMYKEIFNSDRLEYGGSGQCNDKKHFSFPQKWHGFMQHIKIMIPPLAIVVFTCIDRKEEEEIY
ncbi:1,4-alpha-glucan branching protein GlgB [Caldibacillus lycopersici]|uniref:1,4-alpha-glucan branching enzyme GlgB n=1 Tax=Perspicuibacillus lycopersici TaxID=1325689 RepID=A0AAE3IQT4_9BACI|nr:1,4-alpha-glucan branching protein GlgB [Perspicuibacillus lycopersici]MCU9612018.1 1,4-alpha-glucan branching protein GlgB [Perspicuibacillus lycopersici]